MQTALARLTGLQADIPIPGDVDATVYILAVASGDAAAFDLITSMFLEVRRCQGEDSQHSRRLNDWSNQT